MRFLIDAQLPPALATRLVANGHDAEHVADRQMASASDAVIWDFAVQSRSAIVTKDEDFARRKGAGGRWSNGDLDQAPNTRRRQLLAWFEAALRDLIAALDRGETLIEAI